MKKLLIVLLALSTIAVSACGVSRHELKCIDGFVFYRWSGTDVWREADPKQRCHYDSNVAGGPQNG